jgi:hypothetical protein
MQDNLYDRVSKAAEEKAKKELEDMFDKSGIQKWAEENSKVLHSRIFLDIRQVAFTDLKFKYLKEEILLEKVNLIEKKAVIKKKIGGLKSQIKPWENPAGLWFLPSLLIDFLFKIGLSIIPVLSILLIFDPSLTLQSISSKFSTSNPFLIISVLGGVGLVQFFSSSVYKWIISYPEERDNYWERANSYSKKSSTSNDQNKDTENEMLPKHMSKKKSFHDLFFIKIRGKSLLLATIIIIIVLLESCIGYSIINYSVQSKEKSVQIERINSEIQNQIFEDSLSKTNNTGKVNELRVTLKNKESESITPKWWSLLFSSLVFVVANLFYSVSKAFRDNKICGVKKILGRYQADISTIAEQNNSYNKIYSIIETAHEKFAYKGDSKDEKITMDRYRSLLYGKRYLLEVVEEYESVIERIANINNEPNSIRNQARETDI